jgi:hypothetical protein
MTIDSQPEGGFYAKIKNTWQLITNFFTGRTVISKQPFVERLLESENLTDELEDQDANWLLEWGIGRLNEILHNVSDQELAGERVTALMAVIRRINRLSASYQNKEPEDLAAALVELKSMYQEALGVTGSQAAVEPSLEIKQAALEISHLPVRQALEVFVQYCVGSEKKL